MPLRLRRLPQSPQLPRPALRARPARQPVSGSPFNVFVGSGNSPHAWPVLHGMANGASLNGAKSSLLMACPAGLPKWGSDAMPICSPEQGRMSRRACCCAAAHSLASCRSAAPRVASSASRACTAARSSAACAAAACTAACASGAFSCAHIACASDENLDFQDSAACTAACASGALSCTHGACVRGWRVKV